MSDEGKMHSDRSNQGQGNGSGGRSSRKRRRSQRNRRRQEERPQQQQQRQQSPPPQRQKEAARQQREESRSQAESADKLSRANMIVLVDDDPAYVEMESLAVVNYVSGFNPMGFTSAEKALSYLTNPRNAGRIRMVLLSLDLPGEEQETGVRQLLAALKKHDEIPLVAVSERNDASNVDKVIDLGAVGFLPKAFTMEVFVRFVKDLLRNGRVSGWQCVQCGKLVPMDQVDLLNMRPIKCAYRECVSSEIRRVHFGRDDAMEKAG